MNRDIFIENFLSVQGGCLSNSNFWQGCQTSADSERVRGCEVAVVVRPAHRAVEILKDGESKGW